MINYNNDLTLQGKNNALIQAKTKFRQQKEPTSTTVNNQALSSGNI